MASNYPNVEIFIGPAGSSLGHIMVDIETMGKRSGAAVIAIAAVEFDLNTGVTGREFYEKISLQSCIDAGLKMDASTVEWWMNQSIDARKEVFHETSDLTGVLQRFSRFFTAIELYETSFWGNSARFDFGILESAYSAIGMDIPWDFFNERDVRTLVSFNPEVKSNMIFQGTPHNAIDDCKYQIQYCCAIHKTIQVN